MIPNISLDDAISQSQEEFVWRATLRSADVILEQPGLSSDHLPRDEVKLIEYIPTRQQDLPAISCRVDLDKGERFVRYWTTLHQPQRGQAQRLYCIGVEAGGRYAILAFYPTFKKLVVADCRPFCPPWFPETFKILSQGTVIRGGPGTDHFDWVKQGFGGHVEQRDNHLALSAIYE